MGQIGRNVQSKLDPTSIVSGFAGYQIVLSEGIVSRAGSAPGGGPPGLSESLIVKLQKPIGMNRVNQVVLQESSEKNLKKLTLF